MSDPRTAKQERATMLADTLRADFPLLSRSVHGKPLVYLDNAATSQKPRRVIDALVRYYSDYNANVHPGDEIVLTEMEHHSNLVPWQLLAAQTGAVLKFIPFDGQGVLQLDAYERQLSERTKLVALTHVSNVLGKINPVREIAARAHAAGAKVLIDGAQSAPHMPVNVADLGVDFFAFSGHKMCGPTGSGALWARYEILEAMPPF